MQTDPGRPLPAAGIPVIGVSCSHQRARWGAWELPATLLPQRYADRITQAGAIPVLLPPVPGVSAALDRIDALILPGGQDIDPGRYGAKRDPATGAACEQRDEAELALCAGALSRGLPVLGICRGIQLINVARGGTLHQHLPDVVGHDDHAPAPGSYGQHGVWVGGGTRLAAILGADADRGTRTPMIMVPTHHHQAIDRLGKGLTATAWAADGVIEAIELDPAEHPFVLAVQWHPEVGPELSLFRGLAAAAAGAARTPSARHLPVPVPVSTVLCQTREA